MSKIKMLESMIRRIVMEEFSTIKPGAEIIVSGDRGSGKYRVKLIRKYSGADAEFMDPEYSNLYHAIIVEPIDDTYGIKVGKKVLVNVFDTERKGVRGSISAN